MQVVIDIPEDYYNYVKALECIPIRGDGKFEMRSLVRQNIALIQKGTPLPDNATNGDMIKAMFPSEVWLQMKAREFNKSWWNEPYKAESE